MVRVNEDMIDSINKKFENAVDNGQEVLISGIPNVKSSNIEEEKQAYEDLKIFLNELCPKNEEVKTTRRK